MGACKHNERGRQRGNDEKCREIMSPGQDRGREKSNDDQIRKKKKISAKKKSGLRMPGDCKKTGGGMKRHGALRREPVDAHHPFGSHRRNRTCGKKSVPKCSKKGRDARKEKRRLKQSALTSRTPQGE